MNPGGEKQQFKHDRLGPTWIGAGAMPRANAVKRTLVVAAAVIIALGIVREVLRLGYGIEGTSFFSLNREQNIGAWFSTLLLAGSAFLLLNAGLEAIPARKRSDYFWFVMAVTFAALSIDEASSVHEMLMVPLQGSLHTGGLLRYAWVIPALVLVPLFALLSIPFLLNLPRGTAVRFVIAGAIYVGGALGFEMLEGLTDGVGPLFVTLYLIEESMEIGGLLIFFFALMDYHSVQSTADHGEAAAASGLRSDLLAE